MKLQPALVFSSHMVLQRRQPIYVFGKAAAGDTVYVSLAGNQAVASVKDGEWRAVLPAMEAASGLEMTIRSELTADRIILSDVCVGEVWLAGGQSNMEFELRYDVEAPEVLPEANDEYFRFFDYPEVTMPGQIEFGRTEEYGFWRRITPSDARYCSAVGYYFGSEIRKALNVPVGILGCNYGGTAANAWTAKEDLEEVPVLKKILDDFNESIKTLDFAEDERMQIARATADPAVKRAMDDELLMGHSEKLLELFAAFADPDGKGEPSVFGRNSPKNANSPTTLYNYMLRPCAPYGIRGVIWYQGETDNAPYAIHYDKSLKAMRKSWNRLWGYELPIYQVMLAPYDHWGPMPNMDPYPINVIRDLQLKLAKEEEGFYCANIMDSGAFDNIHPRNKRPVGERLALLARKYTYGEDIAADSPVMKDVSWENGRAVVSFEHAGGALTVKGGGVQALKLLIDGEEAEFKAYTEGGTLVIESDKLTGGRSAKIEYARENYCEVNVYGGAGLPLFPFTATHDY